MHKVQALIDNSSETLGSGPYNELCIAMKKLMEVKKKYTHVHVVYCMPSISYEEDMGGTTDGDHKTKLDFTPVSEVHSLMEGDYTYLVPYHGWLVAKEALDKGMMVPKPTQNFGRHLDLYDSTLKALVMRDGTVDCDCPNHKLIIDEYEIPIISINFMTKDD